MSTGVLRGSSPSTVALHGRPGSRGACGPLVTPIVQSTTFVQRAVGECDGPTYSRVGNPTVDRLEEVLGSLEEAPPSVCFGTGLAAETALFLALLRAGDHAVVADAIYGGTVRLFRQVLSELGISATFVDGSDAAGLAAALTPRTRLVFVETPANPTLRLTDIRAVAEVSRRAGVRLVVDNTFLTPVIQRPLDLGADVTVYSTTKHIEGHSTALGGAVTSRDTGLLERVRWIRKCTGGIQAPFNAFLTEQGVKTLPLRIRRQSQSAAWIARRLAEHPAVATVHYPGLDEFPQRELADLQHAGGQHGGVISFEVKGGVAAGAATLNAARLCRLVEHVGGVETLLTHPATMTHADVPREQRERVGLTDGLIRLSVGLEDPLDILDDLDQALRRGAGEPAVRGGAKGGASCATL
ncbi:MAG: aminotransferase class I/II-fold pyridoxal phosphate-dependent enzyme [Phycisphaeraceae bacterium]|nr:aminotransferase class I/II-fold pyridoxal phosphate-dependent enzyme [Phycisphaerae bacterium]MBX3391742.1 aminotransferase class I/II-fold pyridoxal phosphate-dependent enzyme [Phycisphaeraceae bacterium]